jgi:hypothetical protein
MKNKINIVLATIGLFFFATLFSSCLKSNLPTFPLDNGDYINNVYLEYRYESGQTYDGQPVVAYQRLTVNQTIDSANNTISLAVTVPQASGSFSDSIRNLVSQSELWSYFDISTAATMSSVGTTPKPGFSTDFTKPQTYQVTAANGNKRTWTVIISSFTK